MNEPLWVKLVGKHLERRDPALSLRQGAKLVYANEVRF
jgi:hypothetical protein